jgi:hypothetical protein
MHQSSGAENLDNAGDDTEPLAEPDLIKQLHHEWNGSQLRGAGGKKHKRDDDLQDPEVNATAANLSASN